MFSLDRWELIMLWLRILSRLFGISERVFPFFSPPLCSSLQGCFCLLVSIFVFNREALLRYLVTFGFLRVGGLDSYGKLWLPLGVGVVC